MSFLPRGGLFFLFGGIILVLLAGSAFGEPVQAEKEGLIGFSGGVYNFNRAQKAQAVRIEYLSNKRFWKLVPRTGLIITTETALYGYCGLGLELCLTSSLMVIPQANVGLHFPLHGMGLGHPIEFFTNLELAYRFTDGTRLSLSLGHLSHAGFSNINPGSESLAITYTVPLDYVFCHFR